MDHRPWNERASEIGYLISEARREAEKAAELLRSALRRSSSTAQRAQINELVSTANLLTRQCMRASKDDVGQR